MNTIKDKKMNMNSKYILTFFVAIFTTALCAMNRPAPQSPGPQGSSRGSALPESPQSPGERRMRQQHLVRHLGQQIDATIYRVLPRAQVMPPQLNASTDEIVNDWFFEHLTAGQVTIINRIAQAIASNARVTLTGNDVQLYRGFPTRIAQDLRPYLSIPDIETAATEIDTSTSVEASERAGNKKRKK